MYIGVIALVDANMGLSCQAFFLVNVKCIYHRLRGDTII